MDNITITKLSAQEILLVQVLSELAAEAKAASEKIQKNFANSFGIGTTEIKVFQTSDCDEYYGYGYLSISQVFRYRDNWWGGREYLFKCDTEGIYQMFRSAYLRRSNLAELDPYPFDCKIENIDGYFRQFIQQLD